MLGPWRLFIIQNYWSCIKAFTNCFGSILRHEICLCSSTPRLFLECSRDSRFVIIDALLGILMRMFNPPYVFVNQIFTSDSRVAFLKKGRVYTHLRATTKCGTTGTCRSYRWKAGPVEVGYGFIREYCVDFCDISVQFLSNQARWFLSQC